jgi:hypothetical protein
LNNKFETEWKLKQHIFSRFRFRFHQNTTASGASASASTSLLSSLSNKLQIIGSIWKP